MTNGPSRGSVSKLAAEPTGKSRVALPQLVPSLGRQADEAVRLTVIGAAHHGSRDDKQAGVVRKIGVPGGRNVMRLVGPWRRGHPVEPRPVA
eukprot:13418510-Alexandrium_andersonii.AAC.1